MLRRLELTGVFVLLTVGCAGSAGSSNGAPSGAPQSEGVASEQRGDAAKTICEAERRRGQRCGRDKDPSACTARCGTLPVRNPPVWSASWASEVAACIDDMECGHDREERCVFSTKRHTAIGDACLASASESARQQARCEVLQGLTPFAEKRMRDCLQGGGSSCEPEYDWK
jgi:hypothetical protein